MELLNYGAENIMSGRIKGITVQLHMPDVQIGTDMFGEPMYEDVIVDVKNVLVAPATNEEVLETVNLYGKKAVYTLAIPKGDTHDWQDHKVTFFGRDWRCFGIPQEGIEDNIPLEWNKKVTVERYE